MSSESSTRRRPWSHKLRDAFRGVAVGVRGQSSFAVHLLAAASVITTATLLQLDRWKWCVLALCIAIVLAAELFNAALESLSRAVTTERNERVGDALDIAAGAVLITALGAAAVGAIVLGPDLWLFFFSQ